MNRRIYLLFAGVFSINALVFLLIILTHRVQPIASVGMGFVLIQFIVFLIVERPALQNKTKIKMEFAVKQYSLNARRLYMVIMAIILLSLLSYTLFRYP